MYWPAPVQNCQFNSGVLTRDLASHFQAALTRLTRLYTDRIAIRCACIWCAHTWCVKVRLHLVLIMTGFRIATNSIEREGVNSVCHHVR